MLSVLQAIWQADGTFPSGSFAFSYGVEGVVALRSRLDAAALTELATTILGQRWVNCDRVALIQAFRAAGDLDAIADIDQAVELSTFGDKLREGSRRNGASFLAAHARLGERTALALRQAVRSGVCLGHIAVMQGAIWHSIGLDEKLAQIASAYGVASGVTAAAVRLGAVGALDGQKALRGCFPLIETLVAQSIPHGAVLSSFLPYLEIAAARHARAELRLFAN
jgi:urease accessory protein